MKAKYFKILIIILIILVPIFVFGIVNTMVSLKYETDSPKDCISKITGVNLCNSIQNIKIYIALDIILILLLMLFKNRIIKKNRR